MVNNYYFFEFLIEEPEKVILKSEFCFESYLILYKFPGVMRNTSNLGYKWVNS